MKEDAMFWSDRIARLLVERSKFNHMDKPTEKTKKFMIKSSTSISGVPHIGNASDVIRHDAVVRSLTDMGEKVKFIWVSEDMDPLRKVPKNIPPEFKKYLGMPVSALPCPFGCCESYVMHFDRLFIKSLHDEFGAKPELLSTTEAYKHGHFYPYIKLALEKIDVIKGILNKNRTTPLPSLYSPWTPVCDNCGKIITTKIIGMEGDVVKYECQDYSFQEFGKEAYNEVAGCKHKGDSDIKKGNGKLLWKIEWGAEWALWKVNFEGAGKEHYMPGGSFWNAGEICERVYDWPEPYPGKNEIQPYEYIMVGKEKMSASKGNVVATWEWPDFAPPEVLRLIFIKRPNRARGFQYEKIPDSVDELDKLEKIYFDLEKVEDKKELMNNKRLFEMCSIEKPRRYIPKVPFSFCSLLTQFIPDAAGKNFDKVMKTVRVTGHIGDPDEEIESSLKKRLLQAKSWVEKYGDEESRIVLLEDLPPDILGKLTETQKYVLLKMGHFLRKGDAKDLWAEMKKLSEERGVQTAEIFKAAYLVLIGKEKGPRLIPFLQVLDRNFVIKRFSLAG
ncbi:lysine--tRNA ligase [Candidatus Micrarchaeota archaeon RBG_16_49_10]|nr:MAG: lysine--tRNA ligase [Candidatus Micrarchaeota archaeon RBG_16_49_10]